MPRIAGVAPIVMTAWLCAAAPSTLLAASPEALVQIHQQHAELQQQLAATLRPIADICERNGWPDEAARIRLLAEPIEQQTLDIDDLPQTARPALTPALPPAELEWRAPLRKAQTDYANDLYRLAQLAIREGFPSEAFHLVRETAFHDPDHVLARRLLGFVRHEDRWTTPYELLMVRRGMVEHPRFGWLPAAHVERYEQGERIFRGEWMSAEKESALRADLRFAWEVESDNFVVKTNHSLERGVELSRALETLHRFFTREFTALFNSPQQMKLLFDDGRPKSVNSAAKHQVWYFRTREEFVRRLSAKQPGAEGINGLYLPRDRCAYFFANDEDPEANLETMFHEVTHQLLSESSRTTFDVGKDRHFWVIEGIACYMESFDPEHPTRKIGDPDHLRMYWARERVVTENWFVPIDRFEALGMQEFQFGSDYQTLQRYYSQATGLTHFCLHFQNGVYRDRFVEYLAQHYSPDKRVRLQPRSLSQMLNVPYDTLNAQYREYIASLPGDP